MRLVYDQLRFITAQRRRNIPAQNTVFLLPISIQSLLRVYCSIRPCFPRVNTCQILPDRAAWTPWPPAQSTTARTRPGSFLPLLLKIVRLLSVCWSHFCLESARHSGLVSPSATCATPLRPLGQREPTLLRLQDMARQKTTGLPSLHGGQAEWQHKRKQLQSPSRPVTAENNPSILLHPHLSHLLTPTF
jgi:hypothetical protein